MQTMRRFGLFLIGFMIVSCSAEEPATQQRQPSAPPLLQDQVEAIDKARQVEQLMQQKNQIKQQAMEQI